MIHNKHFKKGGGKHYSKKKEGKQKSDLGKCILKPYLQEQRAEADFKRKSKCKRKIFDEVYVVGCVCMCVCVGGGGREK